MILFMAALASIPNDLFGGGEAGERNTATDLFLHQDPVSVIDFFVCDDHVPDQLF